MKTALPINKKLFDIYLLFTREPFVRYFTRELEFYSNGNGGLIGLISLDYTDNDYYGCILSRDKSKQYRTEIVEASIPTIEEARNWIDDKMSSNSIVHHDNTQKRLLKRYHIITKTLTATLLTNSNQLMALIQGCGNYICFVSSENNSFPLKGITMLLII